MENGQWTMENEQWQSRKKSAPSRTPLFSKTLAHVAEMLYLCSRNRKRALAEANSRSREYERTRRHVRRVAVANAAGRMRGAPLSQQIKCLTFKNDSIPAHEQGFRSTGKRFRSTGKRFRSSVSAPRAKVSAPSLQGRAGGGSSLKKPCENLSSTVSPCDLTP